MQLVVLLLLMLVVVVIIVLLLVVYTLQVLMMRIKVVLLLLVVLFGLVFANLSVRLGKLKSDWQRQVWIESDALQVQLGRLCAGSCGKGDKSDRRGTLSVLAGHLQQRVLITLVRPKE